MKKIIAMLLGLALLASCTAVLAEAAEKQEIGRANLNVFGDFTIKAAIPEGYTMESAVPEDYEGLFIGATLVSEDPAKPIYGLVISFNDTWSEYERMNDVPEEELKEIEDSYYDQDEDTVISYTETAYGTKLLLARAADGQIGSVYTIYKGYEIELYMFPAEGQTLTDEQFDLVVRFLSDMDFIEN